MKTMLKQNRLLAWLLLFLVCYTPLQAKDNTQIITIHGIVKDRKSNKKIEYATITVPGTSIGTITNADGEFTLKINDSLQVNTVEVSHIGYASRQLPLDKEQTDDVTVYLTSNAKELREVLIKNQDPLEIVKSAINNIEQNYSDKANLLTGFYRETIRKRRTYISISEAIIEAYKSPYENNVNYANDRVQIFKGRQLMSIKRSDTLAVKFLGGPVLCTYADIVKNPDFILDMETLHHYKFEMEEPVMIDERPHFTISFEPQLILPYPLYFGQLYIDQHTLTISRAELSMSMDDRNKVTRAILRRKPFKLQFKPEEVSFVVSYKQRNGRSYLHYIRNEMRFKCDWKKKWIFSTGYTIVSEMVVTNSKEDDIKNIPGKFAFRYDQALSDKVESFYDENFWEDYNIIEPTESLESAVNKLRKQYK